MRKRKTSESNVADGGSDEGGGAGGKGKKADVPAVRSALEMLSNED